MDIPKIEHSVPLPESRRGRSIGELATKLKELQVGDSMLFRADKKEDKLRIYRTLYRTAKRHDVKTTARFEKDGIRIWKVA